MILHCGSADVITFDSETRLIESLPAFRFGGMRMRSERLAVFLIVFACIAMAQSDRGTITGTIADPAGAVVANAVIEKRATVGAG